jgi:NDP-sugar pyrophosphorylase family protein
MFPAVAILAGGMATRLGDVVKDTPKAMLDVGGRPFIDWQFERLASQGVTGAVLCLGHLAESIRGYAGDGLHGVKIKYSFDGERPLGTGGALKQALPLLSDPFFVLYGDSWLETDWLPLWQRYQAGGAEAVMTVLHNQGRWDKSNCRYEDGRLLSYDKQAPGPEHQHVDYGLSLWSKAVFEGEAREKFDLSDLQHGVAARGGMAGVEVAERFYEIGSHRGLEETRARLLKGKP